jgi:hypothetical protein
MTIQLNYIHRMMARTLMVLLWIHAGGKVMIFSNNTPGFPLKYVFDFS